MAGLCVVVVLGDSSEPSSGEPGEDAETASGGIAGEIAGPLPTAVR